MIDAVVFDIDGTLIDSVELHARCWSRAFLRFGKFVPTDVLRWHIGKGGDQLVPSFLAPEENSKFGKELEAYRSKLWMRSYINRVVPIEGARELVARVAHDGKRVALASSAKEEELAQYVEIIGIREFLHASTSADDADKSKPHPDIFHAALDRVQVPAEHTLVVGDTPYDAIGAKRAGIETLGMLTGGWTAGDLRAAGCIAVYYDPKDLLLRYEDSPFRRMPLFREATMMPEVIP